MKFTDKLLDASRKNKSWLCIGLDPDPELMPEVDVLQFNKAIIEATCDLVCAYKPNMAFYEALGTEGLAILEKTIKRALFSVLGFDAATVNPYLGYDSIEPFINCQDKGVFILCRTSNKGATDFQDLRTDGLPLYEVVAKKAQEWNIHGNIGLVVGATYPDELRRVRSICPEMPLLIPGIGAQGGDLASAIGYGADARGEKAIINVSRQILYASKEKDFAQAARNIAEKIRKQINDHRSKAR
jgi:orotidine-5'-phosphate decarboxylase